MTAAQCLKSYFFLNHQPYVVVFYKVLLFHLFETFLSQETVLLQAEYLFADISFLPQALLSYVRCLFLCILDSMILLPLKDPLIFLDALKLLRDLHHWQKSLLRILHMPLSFQPHFLPWQ